MTSPHLDHNRSSRTVTTGLRGGLGNQMFQYALGRTIAQQSQRHLLLDLRPLATNPPGTTPRAYGLHIFQLDAEFLDARLYESIDVIGFIRECRPSFQSRVLGDFPLGHIHLQGFWQSERYFAPIAATLREDFRFRSGSWSDSPWESRVRSARSPVCVHVRRQDYLTTAAGQRLGFLGQAYYERAIDTVMSTVPDAHFFVFSDDISWCRANLTIRYPHTFVSGADNGTMDATATDFRVMTLCRHFIIANSSFSWWAAWLGTGPGKIVAAPRTWYRDHACDSNDIVPDHWIRI